jgi:RHS repeat-associated protein
MNRLVGVLDARGQTVTMSYDALGRRVGKAVGQVHTHFVWDGDNLLSDSSGDASGHARNPSDHGAREFVFRPDGYEPLALIGETIQYFDNDLVGLPHDLVASDGTSTWTSCYDALGGSYGTQSDACPLRLQGQYFDSETGLSYNRHRYYDPHIGAFISADPLGLEGGHDLYRYAPNIWDWVDIFGLRCQFTGIAKKAKWVRSRQGVEGPGLRGHFGKHGSQVGARNARDYDMSARRTIQNGRRFAYRDRSSGERRVGYWDPDTGFFTATSQTRRTPTIMTHFPETWENLRKLPGFAT